VITLLIILFFMILALILRTTYTKILLAEKLRNREKENEERTKYFVSISRSLRNPLSLIIGQLEILLRSDIAKSGINQIESIYKNAEQMQRVISDYETLENQAVEAEAATYVQPSRISITEARFHEYRMLIADENDEIREMLRTIFSSQYDIIEVKDGMTCTKEEIDEFCLGLPRYKRPKEVIFEPIPRNATGKIEKPVLRKMHGADNLVAKEVEVNT